MYNNKTIIMSRDLLYIFRAEPVPISLRCVNTIRPRCRRRRRDRNEGQVSQYRREKG